MKVGDKVICIKKDQWVNVETCIPCSGPVYKEELVIDNIGPDKGLVFYKYGEYIQFNPKWFKRPDTKHTFTNDITKKLANIPLIEEKVEEIKEKELETI